MKIRLEEVRPDSGSSFRILLTPGLNDLYYWHFHEEYEIVYVEAARGIRHIGDHISSYENNDLVFIGPNIPHLNFDYGVHSPCEQVIVQLKEDFLGKDFLQIPEFASVRQLFENARKGICFQGPTKQIVGNRLKHLPALTHFDQLLELLRIFQILASAPDQILLNSRARQNPFSAKQQDRLNKIYGYVELNYQRRIEVKQVAGLVHLSTAAFCRYFKKTTQRTFTESLNQYRVNQAKKMLLSGQNVTEASFASGFENLSHFNKTFKKLAGENPSHFRKRHQDL
jgi:AraC-like DNA-binding protein